MLGVGVAGHEPLEVAGQQRDERNTAITTAPKIAGITVMANGAGPASSPRYSPSPQITSVPM